MKLVMLILLTTLTLHAKIRIGLLDTTINPIWHQRGLICDDKVYKTSYVNKRYGEDIHADAIIDILYQGIKKPFCIVPVVWYSKNSEVMLQGASASYQSFLEGLKILSKQVTHYVNISVNSTTQSHIEEFNAFVDLHNKTRIFMASGNSDVILGDHCYMYPMCYSTTLNITVVGSKVDKHVRGKFVDVKEDHIYSGIFGYQGGTSMSTPRAIVTDIKKRGL